MLDAILNPRRLAVIGASDSLAQLSVFAAEHADSIDSIDINPFIALPQGGVAVDALIVRRDS